MKKNRLLGIIAILCAGLLLASCSKDDTKIAMKLSGEWDGYWGMYYFDPDHPEWGEWDSYQSTVVFEPYEEYGTSGRGYQMDWYGEQLNDQGYKSPYKYMTYYFDWWVSNGKIRISYPTNPDFNVTIRDYDLSKQRFTGYFNNSTTRFDLHAIEKWYDWWDYAQLNTERAIYWTWVGTTVIGAFTYDNYYYTKTRNGETPVDSLGNPIEVRTPVHIGNRFAEGKKE